MPETFHEHLIEATVNNLERQPLYTSNILYLVKVVKSWHLVACLVNGKSSELNGRDYMDLV